MPKIQHKDDVSLEEISPATVQRLVAYEEAKAAGNGAVFNAVSDSPLAESVASDLACVDLLHRAWPALDSLAGVGNDHTLPRILGDFQIIRELGRGGMGTVFEAEQLTMGRRVALKVLPFAALAHEKSIQRFRNEVRAAAALDHPHIVSVYSIGEDRGVHFYAMQFIRGQTLAEVIHALRKSRDPDSIPAEADRTERFLGHVSTDEAPTVDSSISHPPSTQPVEQAQISTVDESWRGAEQFRSVARLGIQAAEALQHAHDQGVLHRDIKPGNLMLDANGKLYVTDFGLARIEADAGLTMTGDILGTLRYMAPEQALAKRVVIDHRADVYSLGATLYELLTLQPAFGETDRAELLKQIAFEEPAPLRKVDRRVPIELETIVLKAMAKSPEDRYQTAQNLGNDLRAFLENRPIIARPPTVWDRGAKWSRRHVAIVWSAFAASLVISAILVGSTVLISDSRRAAIADRESAEVDRNDAVAQRNEASQNLYTAEIVSGQTNLEQGNFGRLQQKLISHLPLGDEPDRRGWEWYYLFGLCHPEQRALHCELDTVFAAWSPDGEFVGTGDAIWNANTGNYFHLFSPDGGNMDVAWSRDSQQFAWGAKDGAGAIYVWDRKADTVRSDLRGHTNSVWCVAFSPDGKQLASGSIDNTVKIWDVASGEILKTFRVGKNVSDVAWNSNGDLLAVGLCWGGGLEIWSTTTGERVARREENGQSRVRVSWRPDGAQLAVNTPRHWYVLNRSDWNLVLEHENPFIGNSDSSGSDIQWNPTGKQLAVSAGAVVTVWDPVEDHLVTELTAHIRSSVNSVAWSPDGRQLVTSDGLKEIRFWDITSPPVRPAIATGTPLQCLSWEPNNDTLVSVAASDMSSSFWSAADRTLIKTVSAVNRDVEKVLDVGVLSPDRRLTASMSLVEGRPEVLVSDAQSGAVHSVLRLEESLRPLSYQWSPDSLEMAITVDSTIDVRLECWNVNNERRISCWIHPKFNTEASALGLPTWSPDGSQVAVVGLGDVGGGPAWTSHVHIVDVASGKRVLERILLGERDCYAGRISALAWSPDGHKLAIGSSEGLLDVIDVETNATIISSKAQNVSILALDWSPDGRRLVIAAADGNVKLLETVRGHELLTFRLSEDGVTQIIWSSDGKRLAAANEQGLIQIWDATRGFEFAAGGSRHAELAWDYYQQSEQFTGEATIGALRKTLKLPPKALDYRTLRGNAYARLGEFANAAAEFNAVEPPQADLGLGFMYLRACTLLGDRKLDAYREVTDMVANTIRNSDCVDDPFGAVSLATLIPDDVAEFKEKIALIEQQVADGKLTLEESSWLTRQYGAMLYRLERYEDAVRILTSLAERLDPGMDLEVQYNLVCSKYFLAMARHKLGHDFQAHRCLREAVVADETIHNDASLSWTWRVVLDTLHREARELIDP